MTMKPIQILACVLLVRMNVRLNIFEWLSLAGNITLCGNPQQLAKNHCEQN